MALLSVAKNAGSGARSGAMVSPGLFAGFVIATLAVMLIGVLSYFSLRSRTEASQGVSTALGTLDQLQQVLSSLKDAETGQRGFLLTGAESYLDPYNTARAALPGEIDALRKSIIGTDEQRQRLETLARTATEKLDELAETIVLRRSNNASGALSIVLTDRGKAAMDRARSLVRLIDLDERAELSRQQALYRDASATSVWVTCGGCAVLLLLIMFTAVAMSRDYRARQIQIWLRTGQAGFGVAIQGDQRLEQLGENVMQFLARYLDAQVGAIYIAEARGQFRRFAGYALATDSERDVLRPSEGLIGQAIKENRPFRVREVPEGYLPVSSSLGRTDSRELVLFPASIEGRVYAVIELGFLRAVHPADEELLSRLCESLAIAIRSSEDRTRLEDLLEEIQRQAEELQAQQEELRVNNEELEEQGRALRESRGQLEGQAAELEQTNSQLGEQAHILEQQKDELSRAQLVLTDKASELERSNQYKSEFLANMSHELRTPLNSSLILAKLLSENRAGNLTAEQVKFAQTISSAGNDLLALINDILDLSKIESGKVDVTPETVTVSRTVDALIRNLQPLAVQKHLEFNAVIEPGTPERLETDAQRLVQILNNLISNAVKFTSKGEVELRVSGDADGIIRFAVRDTGIGIPKHQQAVIFEAFRQADGSTHRKYGGTGLGLSISRNLARLLGGDVSVTSTPNEGSIFTLTLPLTYAGPESVVPTAGISPAVSFEAAVKALRTTVPPPRPSRIALPPIEIEDDRDRLDMDARLILVIEDDVRFAAILRDLAHEMGFQCIVTHTAHDGLSAAGVYRPSAIVLDMNLPDHSGLGVLDQLKHDPKTRHIPVHVASVADYSQEARELGAIGYALKPVKREQLVEAFQLLEAKFSQGMRRILVVEDDARQRESIHHLLANDDVEIVGVDSARAALAELQGGTFDCIVMDLNLPDLSGYELLEKMAEQEEISFPPVIVYTGRALTRDEEQRLRRYSKSIIIKDARSPERLLDEVTLFLHQVESTLPADRQKMLALARDRESTMQGKRILVVEDDVRNIFALSSILEPRGAKIEVARNGREAIDVLTKSLMQVPGAIDLVLMDIMMPEMDGFTAMREIRKRAQFRKLPIIALTAKAMKDDQEKCMAAGANDYIAKPLDVEKLLSLVRVWMPK